MVIRELERCEIPLVWTIDRREVIANIYYLVEGKLVLKPEHYDMQGWPPGESEIYTPILYDCFDRGGKFSGIFDGSQLIGVMLLESKFIGPEKNQLQLKLLHVSHSCRKTGLGSRLFKLAADQAKALGAQKLYISATPSENTVDFYLQRGCILAGFVDQDLYALEPDDIHLEYSLLE